MTKAEYLNLRTKINDLCAQIEALPLNDFMEKLEQEPNVPTLDEQIAARIQYENRLLMYKAMVLDSARTLLNHKTRFP